MRIARRQATIMRRAGTDERKIFLRSMHGMGDNVHQRAIVRTLLNEGREVWIDTPWPGLYYDFLICSKPVCEMKRLA